MLNLMALGCSPGCNILISGFPNEVPCSRKRAKKIITELNVSIQVV